MTVYDHVKALADEKKVTISKVESECGLGNGTIKSWTSSFPKLDKIYSVACFFNIPLEYFLTGVRPDKEEEFRLLSNFRNCDRDGKDIVLGRAAEERRRSDTERKKVTGEIAG